MNIFYLDKSPKLSAEYACDKHVVKMILESAQLLCSPFNNREAPYKRTHFNHPCSLWVRNSEANYDWMIEYSESLGEEYTYRYNKRHKSLEVIQWCKNNKYKITFIHNSFEEPPQCFGDFREQCFVMGDAVQGYRNYYGRVKAKMAKWTKRMPPFWFRA